MSYGPSVNGFLVGDIVTVASLAPDQLAFQITNFVTGTVQNVVVAMAVLEPVSGLVARPTTELKLVQTPVPSGGQ